MRSRKKKKFIFVRISGRQFQAILYNSSTHTTEIMNRILIYTFCLFSRLGPKIVETRMYVSYLDYY